MSVYIPAPLHKRRDRDSEVRRKLRLWETSIIRNAAVPGNPQKASKGGVNPGTGVKCLYRASVLESRDSSMTWGGVKVAETTELVREASDELKAAKEELEATKNQIFELSSVLLPELSKHIATIRSARMSAVSEMQQTLTMLRDVRRFFLESDYQNEMARLERFVAVCREVEALKKSGVFDAVCDSALRLAEGGGK